MSQATVDEILENKIYLGVVRGFTVLNRERCGWAEVSETNTIPFEVILGDADLLLGPEGNTSVYSELRKVGYYVLCSQSRRGVVFVKDGEH